MDRIELSNWLLSEELERDPRSALILPDELTEHASSRPSPASHSFSLSDLLHTQESNSKSIAQHLLQTSQPMPEARPRVRIPPSPFQPTPASATAPAPVPAAMPPFESTAPALPTGLTRNIVASEQPTLQRTAREARSSNQHARLSVVLELLGQIRGELRESALNLLQLNPTRREAIVHHLERLAGQASPDAAPANSRTPQATTFGANDPQLKSWIVGPLSANQESALNAYFEELALLCIGQAFVLKSWSERGLRQWHPECLARMNWVLSTALQSPASFNREGWQITSRTIYSWYNPSPALQRDIWHTIDAMPVSDEDARCLLGALLNQARQKHASLPTAPDFCSYDGRFFSQLWTHMAANGLTSEAVDRPGSLQPLRRKKKVFSPTIRDGALVRTAPENLEWIGLEQNPFLLMVAELAALWWGPAAPPLWTFGTGLESHSREQMSFHLGQARPANQLMAPKRTLHSLIGEIESCDLAFILEDHIVRSNSRSLEGQRLREQIEEFPVFKRIRSAGTSLGDLQACSAISKLRPGGLLWWAREEALSEQDGRETLTYLLERGRLIAEVNFAGLKVQSRGLNRTENTDSKLLPKHLYLWVRDTDIPSRHAHRPLRLSVQGKIPSAAELSKVLPEILDSALRTVLSRLNGTQIEAPRSSAPGTIPVWQVHAQLSPSTQKEWAEHWPEPTGPDQLQEIARLRQTSLPLAAICTVRSAHTLLPSSALHAADPTSAPLSGILLRGAGKEEGRKLRAESLQTLRRDLERKHNSAEAAAHLTGAFHILIAVDEGRIAPLLTWLESPVVRRWIDHHAERKGDRWVLNEQIVKYIPVPRQLLRALGVAPDRRVAQGAPGSLVDSQQTFFLSPEWEKAAMDLTLRPRLVLEKLRNEAAKAPQSSAQVLAELKAALFVRAAQVQSHLKHTQSRLMAMVSADGKIQWREVFGILPPSEFSSVPMHSAIRMTGTLPPQIPISRWERTRMPSAGILLATDSGFHLHIGCESPRLLDMVWDQLQGLKHPVWAELAPWLKLPRNPERVEQTANELLHAWHEQNARMQELQEFIDECMVF